MARRNRLGVIHGAIDRRRHAITECQPPNLKTFQSASRGAIRLGRPTPHCLRWRARIIKVLETCFPRSAHQRCLAPRLRNLAAKVHEDLWLAFKVRATAAYRAPSPAITRELADGLVGELKANCRVRWAATWTTSSPASRTFGCPSSTVARPARQIYLSVCSLRSAAA